MQCTNVGVGMSQQLSLKDTHTHKHLKEHNSVNCEKMNRLLSVIAAADWGLFICQNCSRLTTQVKARNS